MTVFSLFMLSLAQPGQYYQVYLAQGVGLGLGAGLTYIPSVAVLAQHFPAPQERALMMMLVASGSSMGGVVHPIMLNNLFSNPNVGFATGVRASAGMLAGMLIIALACMRTNNTGGAKQQAKRDDLRKSITKFSTDRLYVVAVIGYSSFL